MGNKILKSPTIRRLPTYLQKLFDMAKNGETIVATPILAKYMNIGEIVVRKDLAITGITGQPGVGYKINELIAAIKNFLNCNSTSNAVLVGAGSLGSAILGYEGFEEYGLNIIAAFDASKEKIGKSIHNREILDIKEFENFCLNNNIKIGIICVPALYAQAVGEMMVDAKIKAIWNFANVALNLPPDIVVQREVIAGGLALLFVKLGASSTEDID